jgi:hypothetical protein
VLADNMQLKWREKGRVEIKRVEGRELFICWHSSHLRGRRNLTARATLPPHIRRGNKSKPLAEKTGYLEDKRFLGHR